MRGVQFRLMVVDDVSGWRPIVARKNLELAGTALWDVATAFGFGGLARTGDYLDTLAREGPQMLKRLQGGTL